MTQVNRVVILGGHGKVALLATPKLVHAGFSVDSVIRNPAQRGDIENTGGRPVILDMETATVDQFVTLFDGASAIVFSAGAGGGNPKRTHAVDYKAALRTMQAAEHAKVPRYVMVSYARVAEYCRKLDPGNSFYPYCKAKYDADAYLRRTSLDYTILGPGLLNLKPATKKFQMADDQGQVNGAWADNKKISSRGNVAEAIVHVLLHQSGICKTLNFYDGEMPLDQAFGG
ncbi:MAG: SDR family oxidoreductase [Nevskiaceae bacterium]|nr:MAG: SDR family oxidoreductase [Nevskiaceae bacterium]TBR73756.1 MAG: SDR family oxidoreductase [Nevskiaceae bacterium]